MIEITYGPKIDYTFCSGCRICYDTCSNDVFGWDGDKELPTVAYPGECWHCGTCELDCPERAINVEAPLNMKLWLGIYPKVGPTA
jgi:NAD-dependent dihydropyrimidine dehydrogenase PreA subunit